MKYGTLIAAAAVILIANGAALIHAARNRSAVEAELTLGGNELSSYSDSENSGVALQLMWTDPNMRIDDRPPGPGEWLDTDKLRSLGFDVSVPAADSRAPEFYQRQMPRTAYVALEYNGPAWQAYLASRQEQAPVNLHFEDRVSRLVAIDAALDPAALRLRHPDRASVLIVPAIIEISSIAAHDAMSGRPAVPARIAGRIQQIPAEIHVPLPFSEQARGLPGFRRNDGANEDRYRAHIKYGKLLEPWVTSVDLTPLQSGSAK